MMDENEVFKPVKNMPNFAKEEEKILDFWEKKERLF